MSILKPPPPGTPLQQGDILKGVLLCHTNASNKVVTSSEEEYCMVISRRCSLSHAKLITVSAVKAFGVEFQKGQTQTLESVKRLFAHLREGVMRPDIFYLGEMPNTTNRYAAQLNRLYTIEVPAEGERGDFLTRHRIANLDEEFIKDLHNRIFTAFARMGFDDYGWYSDADLHLVISIGEQEVASLNKELKDAHAAEEVAAAGNENQKKLLGLKTATENAQKKVDEKTEELAPYLAEMKRRQQ